jgi:CRP-like cAMP-binding protein
MVPNGHIGAGDFFGESALLEKGGRRKATVLVVSEEGAEVYCLSREKFEEVLGQSTLSHMIVEKSKSRIERLGQATVRNFSSFCPILFTLLTDL